MKSTLLAILIALTLGGFSAPASADAESPLAQKAAAFTQVFHGSAKPQFFYHPLYCSANVFGFYFVLRELEISRDGDYVVVIFEKDRSTFKVSNVRLSENITSAQPFSFHVVYVSGGRVFDFDYAQSPTVDDIETYLDKQFPRNSGGHKNLMARIYRTENYIKAYNGPSGNPLILDRESLSEKLVDLRNLGAALGAGAQ